MNRGAKVQVNCARCGDPFLARVADRQRGWGRFCSKSCKAVRQAQVLGHGAPGPRDDWDSYARTVHPFSSEAFEP